MREAWSFCSLVDRSAAFRARERAPPCATETGLAAGGVSPTGARATSAPLRVRLREWVRRRRCGCGADSRANLWEDSPPRAPSPGASCPSSSWRRRRRRRRLCSSNAAPSASARASAARSWLCGCKSGDRLAPGDDLCTDLARCQASRSVSPSWEGMAPTNGGQSCQNGQSVVRRLFLGSWDYTSSPPWRLFSHPIKKMNEVCR